GVNTSSVNEPRSLAAMRISIGSPAGENNALTSPMRIWSTTLGAAAPTGQPRTTTEKRLRALSVYRLWKDWSSLLWICALVPSAGAIGRAPLGDAMGPGVAAAGGAGAGAAGAGAPGAARAAGSGGAAGAAAAGADPAASFSLATRS